MASSRENTTTNDIYFIWDLLNPIVRFLLLNQTQVITYSPSFNITHQILTNSNGLNWNELPGKVQTLLMSQNNNNAILSLTFSQWGWTESVQYANLTLKSLLPNWSRSSLADILNVMKPVQLDLKIDLIYLNKLIRPIWWHRYSLNEFLNSIFEYFPGGFVYVLESTRYKRQIEHYFEINVAKKIVSQGKKILSLVYKMFGLKILSLAIYRAELFLSTVNTTSKALRIVRINSFFQSSDYYSSESVRERGCNGTCKQLSLSILPLIYLLIDF
jgi:hypothetical protein